MVLTGLVYPASAIVRLSANLRSRTSCSVVQAATWVCVTTSSLFTILLAFDRLLYFRTPRFYKALTKTAVIATCLIVTILCAGLTLSLWIFEVATANDLCTLEIRATKLLAYDVFVAAFYVLPVLVALILGTYLFFAVYKRRRYPEFPSLSCRPSPKMASLAFLTATATLAALTLLPNRMLVSWRLHSSTTVGCTPETLLIAASVLQCLAKVYPLAKPLVIFALLRPYKKALKMALCRGPQSETRGWFDE